MNNFRRRLGERSSIDYVFSAESTSVSVSYNSSSKKVNITSTANGTNIGYSVVSYDGTVVTSVTTAATSVTINYSDNPTYRNRTGNVVLKQDDSNKTITINVSQSASPVYMSHDCILLDGTNGSTGSVLVGDSVIFTDVPSWANVTYSSGRINVTASSSNSASTARLATINVQGKSLVIIQLPSDYHSRSYVSIGVLNWAIKNVGASSVKDYGNYYKYGSGSKTYFDMEDYYRGTEDPLSSSADTATQVMGSGWRTPTSTELQYLINNTNQYLASYNGVNGYVVNSSGNVLFFPSAGRAFGNSIGIAGYYWSSTPLDSTRAYDISFYGSNSTRYGSISFDLREFGYSVRGVAG